MKLLLSTLLSAAFVSAAAFAVGQPIAEMPRHHVGDSWTFKQVESPGDSTNEWTRTVRRILPNDMLAIGLEDGRERTYTAAGTGMFPEGPEYSRVLMRFPVKVGDEWSFVRKVGGGENQEQGSGKVLAFESLTVPAGTFDCFRHEVDAWLNIKAYSEHRVYRRWYCPMLKWIAKEIVETQINDLGSGPSRTSITSSELVRFSVVE